MDDPILGTVYALERRDLMKVYVGQTIHLKHRLRVHRRVNRCGLYTNGEPIVVLHGKAEMGGPLIKAEKAAAREYEAAGWDVVSENTKRVGWHSSSGRSGGSKRAENWPKEQIETWGSVGGQASKDGRGGFAAAARLTPEQRRSQRGWGMRRRCTECGMETGIGALGRHQKASGHVGFVNLPPKT